MIITFCQSGEVIHILSCRKISRKGVLPSLLMGRDGIGKEFLLLEFRENFFVGIQALGVL